MPWLSICTILSVFKPHSQFLSDQVTMAMLWGCVSTIQAGKSRLHTVMQLAYIWWHSWEVSGPLDLWPLITFGGWAGGNKEKGFYCYSWYILLVQSVHPAPSILPHINSHLGHEEQKEGEKNRRKRKWNKEMWKKWMFLLAQSEWRLLFKSSLIGTWVYGGRAQGTYLTVIPVRMVLSLLIC